MNTERRRDWRGMVAMPMLFVASFVATYWMTMPAASKHPTQSLEAGTSGTGWSTDNPLAAAGPVGPAPAVESDVGEPVPEALPSLHDLATDNDPATRLEAQAVLTLLDQERATQ
jgi:hypothetical protein